MCSALIDAGQYEAAEAKLLPALEKDPDNTEILNLLGLCCLRTKQLDRAASCFQRIIELDPEAIVAHNNLGTVYKVSNQLDKAEKVFGLCLEKEAENKHALLQMADIKRLKQHFREAIDLYDQAIELYPEDPVYLNNLGVIYQNLGLLDKSMDYFRRAFKSDPDKKAAYNNFLLSLNYLHTYGDEKMTPETLFREHEKWGKTKEFTPNAGPQHFTRARGRDKKIKLAYLSQDFWRHSVSYFFEPVIESHDKEHFEIYCYADIFKPDQVTERIQSHADVWRNINGWSSQAIAEQIRRDQIDILVELGGHTAPNLLQVCTDKPAPVQVTWIGYPATTGLAAMDYRFTDETADPPGEADNWHTERLVRLPECFLCYRPIDDAPPIMPYLSKNWQGITFASFNKITKISDKTAELWAAILNRLPDARLFLKSKGLDDPETKKRYLDLFEEHGISKNRILLKSWYPSIHASLDAYNTVDIALDTFPYNGTTTTCEAFWMGVPVITLCGDRHAARVSASLLKTIGLEELVAESEEEYVEKAVALARDRFRLQKYRSTTRQMMQQSPLCDKQGHTRKVETAFRKIWEAYCDNPEAFTPDTSGENRLPPQIPTQDLTTAATSLAAPKISPQSRHYDTSQGAPLPSGKPTMRILHHMARSGGTIISRCLGAMKDSIVLSEVHPASAQGTINFFKTPGAGRKFDPAVQARQWYHLLTQEEVNALHRRSATFVEVIERINQRARAQSKQLILRDWSHLDFTAVPFFETPSYELTTADILRNSFEVIQTTTVRHPIDQWLSLRRLSIMDGQIDIEKFLYGYMQFAREADKIGFVRYEDFTEGPDHALKTICERLQLPFDPEYRKRWMHNTKITGDTSSNTKFKEIKPQQRKPMEPGLAEEFARHNTYWEALELLGYEHPIATEKRYIKKMKNGNGRLPKILTTSVIRSARQGQSHGGIYLIDLETESHELVYDWDKGDISWDGRGMDRGLRGIVFYGDLIYIAASDELFVFNRNFQIINSYRNPYLKHCHEICLHNQQIFLSSTGFDSVLGFNPETEHFESGYVLRNKAPAPTKGERPNFDLLAYRFDPNSEKGPSPGDSIHINSVYSYQDKLYISALRVPYLFELFNDNYKVYGRIPTWTHNARPFKNGIIFNHTKGEEICFANRNGKQLAKWPILSFDESELINKDIPEDHARQGFGRGLSIHNEEIIIGGSSPATISVYSLKENRFLKFINLTKDIRNAIHGLAICPYEL